MALSQSHFRFGKDDGTEAAHTFWQLEDTNHPQFITADWTFLLRFCVQADTTGLTNVDSEFQYNKNGAGWVNITTTSSVVKAVAVGAFTNGQDCTKRLSGTGTFEANAAGCTEDGISGGTSNDIVASGNSETEAGLQVVFANVANNDTIQFRLTRDGGVLLNTYAVTPTLTVTVPVNTTVTPGTASLTTTKYIPVVTFSDNILVIPGVLALTTTKYTPVVTASDNITVIPSVAGLTTTRYIPVIVLGTVVTPGLATLTTTLYIPTVSVVAGGTTVIPGTASLVTTRFIPVITISDNKTVIPGVASLTTSLFTPSIILGTVVVPNTASLVTARYTPTVAVSENVLVTLGVASLITTRYTPTIIISDNKTVILGLVSLITSRYAPVITIAQNLIVTPNVASLILTGFIPVLKLKINLPTVAGKSYKYYAGQPPDTEFEII